MEKDLRKPSLITLVVAIVVVLLLAFVFFSRVYTDILWYNQLGYASVFWRENGMKIGMGVVGTIIAAAIIFTSGWLAFKNRPVLPLDSTASQNLKPYQEALEAGKRIFLFGIPIGLGIFGGLIWSGQWQTFLLWWNRVPFGKKDPQFNHDISFYTNTLPWISFLVGFLLFMTIIATMMAGLVHYVYGGFRYEKSKLVVSKPAKLQFGVLGAIIMLLVAANFWLSRYFTLNKQGGKAPGALYSDVNALIPAQAILTFSAIIVAAFFAYAAVTNNWRIPIIGTAMLIITSLVISSVYPFVMQRFYVQPSELTLERPYMQRNIEATKDAYSIDKVKSSSYNASTNTRAGALRNDAETTASIRLLDPSLVSASFAQLEQYRQYYSFESTLDVDRYNIGGKNQDTVIATRELNIDAAQGGQNNWYNQHIVYTHGYGIVAAYGNKRADDGKPVFMEHGIPSQGVLGKYEARIYFGQKSPDYSIVGAPAGSAPKELDYPQDNAGKGEANTTFKGNGGPKISNIFRKIAFSLRFGSEQILLSDAVNKESQILYDRDPKQRIEKVAPFLTVDGDPYPAVVDGRVKWIVDAYTTSNGYPYSTSQELDSATTDSQTQNGGTEALPKERVNYIRNSVKATVDAYDGSVQLYTWDENDPILKSWEKAFPGVIKPTSDMSAQLVSHVRYPEDLFKVQRTLLSTYHVKTADELYSKEDAWQIPNDPSGNAGKDDDQKTAEVTQPPYYLTLEMPGQKSPSFSLTSSFIPLQSSENSRNVLTGFLAADSNAGSEAGKKGTDYGTLRLLELPRDTVVPGPGQAQNNFNADPTVSQALNLLRQGSSQVQNGNLLTLPVAGGLLYVQPVYVRSSGETSYPLLQRVLVAFGDKIGFAPTLNEALDQLFSGSSGAQAGDADASSSSGKTAENKPQSAEEQLNNALSSAAQAMKDGQNKLKAGDFAGYGEAQKKLQASLEQATKAQEELSK
ncbi:MAG: UPF0182 family protein [Micrococcaceae bacterium]